MPSIFELRTTFPIALIAAPERLFKRTFSASFLTFWSLFVFSLLPGSDSKALPDIYWNSSNPIFRIDNTEHVFVVKIHDRVDFVCPSYNPSADPADVEVMEIYSVSKWAYDYCALTPDSVVVGVCNNPFQRTYATVVFREYTPKPGGLEFKPGRSYYFISASTGQAGGVQNKHGGLCASKNMKVKFEVESVDSPDAPASKSVDGYPAAGGEFAQTKAPRRVVDNDDGYDDQYQMVASAGGGGPIEIDSSLAKPGDDTVSGSSRTHDNSRELKKQNVSVGNELDVTTPRLYEIHTRAEGDVVVDSKRTDYKEHYGSNAQQRRNAALISFSDWRILFLMLGVHSLYLLSVSSIS